MGDGGTRGRRASWQRCVAFLRQPSPSDALRRPATPHHTRYTRYIRNTRYTRCTRCTRYTRYTRCTRHTHQAAAVRIVLGVIVAVGGFTIVDGRQCRVSPHVEARPLRMRHRQL